MNYMSIYYFRNRYYIIRTNRFDTTRTDAWECDGWTSDGESYSFHCMITLEYFNQFELVDRIYYD